MKRNPQTPSQRNALTFTIINSNTNTHSNTRAYTACAMVHSLASISSRCIMTHLQCISHWLAGIGLRPGLGRPQQPPRVVEGCEEVAQAAKQRIGGAEHRG